MSSGVAFVLWLQSWTAFQQLHIGLLELQSYPRFSLQERQGWTWGKLIPLQAALLWYAWPGERYGEAVDVPSWLYPEVVKPVHPAYPKKECPVRM